MSGGFIVFGVKHALSLSKPRKNRVLKSASLKVFFHATGIPEKVVATQLPFVIFRAPFVPLRGSGQTTRI
jgi:hypothetical protein